MADAARAATRGGAAAAACSNGSSTALSVASSRLSTLAALDPMQSTNVENAYACSAHAVDRSRAVPEPAQKWALCPSEAYNAASAPAPVSITCSIHVFRSEHDCLVNRECDGNLHVT